MSYNGYNDPFPWKVRVKDIGSLSRSRIQSLLELHNDMTEFCNNMTDHWGYQAAENLFVFAFEEHKNWFILKFGEYLE